MFQQWQIVQGWSFTFQTHNFLFIVSHNSWGVSQRFWSYDLKCYIHVIIIIIIIFYLSLLHQQNPPALKWRCWLMHLTSFIMAIKRSSLLLLYLSQYAVTMMVTMPLHDNLPGSCCWRPSSSVCDVTHHTQVPNSAHIFQNWSRTHLMALFPGVPRWASTREVKTNLDFIEARDNEWQWHQLGHMQARTLLQTDNHSSTPPLSFLQAGCPSCCPTNSVEALKAHFRTGHLLKFHVPMTDSRVPFWLMYVYCNTFSCFPSLL